MNSQKTDDEEEISDRIDDTITKMKDPVLDGARRLNISQKDLLI